MLTSNRLFKNIARSLGCAAIILFTYGVYAGWTGGMNGTGYGWAGVNVVSSVRTTNTARTANISLPSAAITPFGYKTNAALPTGASLNTYTRTKGSAGYVWLAATSGSTGDGTDNLEIEKRVVIKPANCTLLTMESELLSFDPQSGSGSFVVKTLGTAGTALLLRGYEVDDVTAVPQDNPATPQDESVEYLKGSAALKFENLIIGPFEYGYNGKCELIIHFTLNEPNLDNFIFTTDGVAKSNPITVTCPGPITVQCLNNFVYPAAEVNTCRDVTLTYEPDESELHAGENLVTVTATDDLGDSGTCTFIVNVVPSEFVGFYAPIGAIGGDCSLTAKDINVGSKIPVKFDFKCGNSIITTGTPPAVKIQRWSNTCGLLTSVSINAEYQNDWHINWDTTGWQKGIYKIIAVLPDGTSHFVFVKLVGK